MICHFCVRVAPSRHLLVSRRQFASDDVVLQERVGLRHEMFGFISASLLSFVSFMNASVQKGQCSSCLDGILVSASSFTPKRPIPWIGTRVWLSVVGLFLTLTDWATGT